MMMGTICEDYGIVRVLRQSKTVTLEFRFHKDNHTFS